MTDDDFRDILRTYWGYDDFRGIQLPIIRSIASGQDTLGLMPTGGGKSITFQVPAMAMEGLCVVVTPLIALMKDQVDNLRRRGILAAAIHSGLSHNEMLMHLDNAVYGGYKFLYVSPERLGTSLFQAKFRYMKVCFLTVDEAHCITYWGHDFRPAYLRIADIRLLKPDMPVLALTATATPTTATAIMESLHFRLNGKEDTLTAHKFEMSFARKNLAYVVRKVPTHEKGREKTDELLHILRSVPGCAIVYTRSREGTEEVANWLNEQDITATFFHAGLNDVVKDVRQRAWQDDEVRVMVATNAFGMGIDKPNVRLVVHLDVPDSIEAYFQEAGRAGRDGRHAYAVLLHDSSDSFKLRRRVQNEFPTRDLIRRIYDEVAYFLAVPEGDGFERTYEFNLERFCVIFRHFPTKVVSALHLLEQAGYFTYRDEDDATSRVLFLTSRDDLYRLNHLDSLSDRIIYSLLRRYGGLFADYVFINEADIATDVKATGEEIYNCLKSLTQQRILHYIPKKHIPRITYLTRRIDSKNLFIGKDIYEDRMAIYEERISGMVNYVENSTECRSQLLLAYFGDDDAPPCGHCDVCIEERKHKQQTQAVIDRLLSVFADGQPHDRQQLEALGFPKDALGAAIRELSETHELQLTPKGWVLKRDT